LPVLARFGRRSAIRVKEFLTGMKADKLLLLSVLIGACLAMVSAARLLAIPYEIDYGEGAMLQGALSIRHSQPLYANPFAFPVVLHMYGPVAYAAVACFLPGGTVSFAVSRALIVACSVVLSLLLSYILRHMTGSWRVGLAFGLLLLTLPAFRFWLYLVRADVIGVVLSVMGVAVYTAKPKIWFCSIPFFGLAIFCKYTLIAAPLAVFTHLILNRQWKRGMGFAAALGFLGSLAFAALQITSGGWFTFHMFSTHPGGYSVLQFFALAGLVWGSAPVVTALALWYVAQDFRGRGRSFAAIYFAASCVTAVSAGKLGSTTNHFLEWMVASCLCSGLAYSLLAAKYPTRVAPITVLLGVSILVAVIVQNRPHQQPTTGLTECGKAYQYVRDSPSSRILSESLSPLLMAGKPILVSDPFAYSQLVEHGGWPDRKVEQLVKQRYFGLIILGTDPSQMKLRGSDAWSEWFSDAVTENYRTVARFSCRGAAVMLEPISPSQDQPKAAGASELGPALMTTDPRVLGRQPSSDHRELRTDRFLAQHLRNSHKLISLGFAFRDDPVCSDHGLRTIGAHSRVTAIMQQDDTPAANPAGNSGHNRLSLRRAPVVAGNVPHHWLQT